MFSTGLLANQPTKGSCLPPSAEVHFVVPGCTPHILDVNTHCPDQFLKRIETFLNRMFCIDTRKVSWVVVCQEFWFGASSQFWFWAKKRPNPDQKSKHTVAQQPDLGSTKGSWRIRVAVVLCNGVWVWNLRQNDETSICWNCG